MREYDLKRCKPILIEEGSNQVQVDSRVETGYPATPIFVYFPTSDQHNDPPLPRFYTLFEQSPSTGLSVDLTALAYTVSREYGSCTAESTQAHDAREG